MSNLIKNGLLLIGVIVIIASIGVIFIHDVDTVPSEFNIKETKTFIWALALMCAGFALIHYNLTSLAAKTTILMAIYTVLGVGTSHVIEELDQVNAIKDQQMTVLSETSDLRSQIENAIWEDLNLSNAMISMMQNSNYQFSDDDFNNYAEMIVSTSPRVRHVALAENLIVSHVFPLAGNEGAKGLNYRENPQQLPMVQKAIDEDRAILAGPVNLVQGGTALIGRIPLTYREPKQSEKAVWGIMSIIVDTEVLFQALATNEHLQIAIRGKDARGDSGGSVFGNQNVFEEQAITTSIRLPYGSWQMAVLPLNGWTIESPNAWAVRTSIGLMWFVVLLFTLARAFQHYKTKKSIEGLHDELEDSSDREDKITQQQRAQAQTQKLEAIGQLTGGIAHDFNNILAAITGYAQLSKMLLDNKQYSDKLTDHIQEIIKAGDRAKSLVKQMLTFSRGRDVRAEVIEPMAVLQETLQMMHSILPASIRLNTNYQDFDSRIKIDPVQLQQVLINLVVNARDAIPNSKGNITISTQLKEGITSECTSCNSSFSGDYLCLSVEDDGLGITREHIEKVFDPFFTTKEVGKGTGMGLSVVHGIIHGVDGHIVISSKLNQGTRIELMFEITTEPLSEKAQDFELPAIDITNLDTRKKVLIIDDETPITQLYDDVLEAQKINSIIFNEPELALDYFRQNQEDIAVVVTDYTMPQMNGTDLIKAIRRLNTNIPIILCSGNADVIDRQIFEDLMINHFLTKPIDLANLGKLVVKYL